MEPFEQDLDEMAADRGSNLQPAPVVEDTSPGYGKALITLAVCWILALLGPLSMLFPLIAVFVFLSLVSQRKLRAASLIALGTPCTIFLVLGIADYARGTARIRGMGLPGTTYHNPDRITRLGRSTGGCIVTGGEWVSIMPYNLAVMSLSVTVGPMRGLYLGPYPTENEAKLALKNGTNVPQEDLAKDVLDVGGTKVRLDSSVGSELLDKLRFEDFEVWNIQPQPPITAAIYEDDCTVLRIPYGRDETGKSAAIVLIDNKKGRPFAYYAEGDYYHRFPPVSYKRTNW